MRFHAPATRAERGEPGGRGSPRGKWNDGDRLEGGLDGDGTTTASARGSRSVDGDLRSVLGVWCSSGLDPFSEDDDRSTGNSFR